MRAKLCAVATAAVLTSGLAACGGSPTSTSGDAGSGGGGESSSGTTLQDVYAELEGLEGEARLKRLEELASEEDAKATWYTSMNLEDSKPVTDGFSEVYPEFEIEIYRASSSDVLERLMQEAKADHAGTDLVSLNGPEMQILDREGLLQPLETPTRDEIADGARFETWLGIYQNIFAAGWNTDEISPSEAPKTWEDVLANHSGQLAMEIGDWDWFATLVEEYFMKEKGMTEDAAIQLFHEAARGATMVDGHTTMAELMVAGEYEVVSSAYQHRLLQLQKEGAPVGWEPPPQPLIIRPNGIGLHRDVDAPATSLLFIEYALNAGQETIVGVSRLPANTTYGTLPETYESVPIDFDQMLDERAKWEKLYEKVVEETGEDVIVGN